MQGGASNVVPPSGSLPLFVFPTCVNFYTNEPASHQQVLTIYNPYNFTLSYKVLCTAPRKYRVIDSQGNIKPRCCVDIYIKHREVCAGNEKVCDKFRLQVTQQGHKTLLGRRDISSILLARREEPAGVDEKFESLPDTNKSSNASQPMQHNAQFPNQSGVSWVVLLAGLLCFIVLMMPTHTPPSPSCSPAPSPVPSPNTAPSPDPGPSADLTSSPLVWWNTLVELVQVSVHQKLIAAYILGLITMVVLRS